MRSWSFESFSFPLLLHSFALRKFTVKSIVSLSCLSFFYSFLFFFFWFFVFQFCLTQKKPITRQKMYYTINKVWNMFKVNYKDTRTTPIAKVSKFTNCLLLQNSFSSPAATHLCRWTLRNKLWRKHHGEGI